MRDAKQVWRATTALISLIVLLVCLMMPYTGFAVAQQDVLSAEGDLNQDGEVSTVDTRIVVQYIVGLSILTEEQLIAADFNGDGKVNSADVRVMLTSFVHPTTTTTTTTTTGTTSTTTMPTTTTTTATAEDPYNLLQEKYIADGRENITINDDGSWTVTGDFSLAPRLTFDYTLYPYLFQSFTTDTKLTVTVLDRDPEGEYRDHWINLYENFVGGNVYPVGTYHDVNDYRAIYDWNIANDGWQNVNNTASIRSIYIEFNKSSPKATFEALRLLPEGFCADYNLLREENTEISEEGATFSYSDSGLEISSAGDNGSIGIKGIGEYDVQRYAYVHISLTSDVPFSVSLYDAVNNKWMTSGDDFFPQFGGDAYAYTNAPAGSYTVSLYVKGYYLWNNGEIPASVSLDAIYIDPKAKGTIVINHLSVTDEEVCDASAPEIPPALTPLAESQYYGRQLLLQEDANLAAAYDHLGEQVKAFATDIDMHEYGLTLNEFEKVLRYYHDDHPEAFWLSLSYGYSYWTMDEKTYIHTMTQSCAYTPDELKALQAELETAAQALLDGITDETPYAQRVRWIHDRLILSAGYDTSYAAPHNHDLLGVMLYKTGVCESYARAFQYLMYRSGINALLQIGDLKADGVAHMWNLVDIDGNWYQIDLTYDDPVFSTPNPDYVRYTYYNITTADMEAERVIYRATSYFDNTYYVSYPYPVCTATAENFFVKAALDVTSFDLTVIGKEVARSILQNDVAVLRPTGTYSLEALKTNIVENIYQICVEANKNLPADGQLKRPGYSLEVIERHGVISLHIRDYS